MPMVSLDWDRKRARVRNFGNDEHRMDGVRRRGLGDAGESVMRGAHAVKQGERMKQMMRSKERKKLKKTEKGGKKGKRKKTRKEGRKGGKEERNNEGRMDGWMDGWMETRKRGKQGAGRKDGRHSCTSLTTAISNLLFAIDVPTLSFPVANIKVSSTTVS
jgi:hypothetical protein